MASTINLRIKVAWWFQWYAVGVVGVARLMNADPDPVKVERWARRAITVTVVRDDGQG